MLCLFTKIGERQMTEKWRRCDIMKRDVNGEDAGQRGGGKGRGKGTYSAVHWLLATASQCSWHHWKRPQSCQSATQDEGFHESTVVLSPTRLQHDTYTIVRQAITECLFLDEESLKRIISWYMTVKAWCRKREPKPKIAKSRRSVFYRYIYK